MKIELEQVGKKFNRQWLFKDISFIFGENGSYAVTGNNGSGKSTLLQMIYGFQTVSKGKIIITGHEKQVIPELIYQQTSFVSPYLELPEELTLKEMLHFHFHFKQRSQHSLDEIMQLSKLETSADKQIRLFSSGMKQRLKLALAFFSETPLLLLDEPCSNLDNQGISWYHQMINKVIGTRTIIIASNQAFEYERCEKELDLAIHIG